MTAVSGFQQIVVSVPLQVQLLENSVFEAEVIRLFCLNTFAKFKFKLPSIW